MKDEVSVTIFRDAGNADDLVELHQSIRLRSVSALGERVCYVGPPHDPDRTQTPEPVHRSPGRLTNLLGLFCGRLFRPSLDAFSKATRRRCLPWRLQVVKVIAGGHLLFALVQGVGLQASRF